jgi:hypothetical protein
MKYLITGILILSGVVSEKASQKQVTICDNTGCYEVVVTGSVE